MGDGGNRGAAGLNGATRLFPIIGDPIEYGESPMRVSRTFAERDFNGVCVPVQVPAVALEAVMVVLTAAGNVNGLLVTMPHKFAAFAYCTAPPALSGPRRWGW